MPANAAIDYSGYTIFVNLFMVDGCYLATFSLHECSGQTPLQSPAIFELGRDAAPLFDTAGEAIEYATEAAKLWVDTAPC